MGKLNIFFWDIRALFFDNRIDQNRTLTIYGAIYLKTPIPFFWEKISKIKFIFFNLGCWMLKLTCEIEFHELFFYWKFNACERHSFSLIALNCATNSKGVEIYTHTILYINSWKRRIYKYRYYIEGRKWDVAIFIWIILSLYKSLS